MRTGWPRSEVERLCLPDVDGLITAWEHTPPQAVSLHWIREMVAAWLGVKIDDGPKAEPVPLTSKARDWLEETLAGMGGLQSPEVFDALQDWEVKGE